MLTNLNAFEICWVINTIARRVLVETCIYRGIAQIRKSSSWQTKCNFGWNGTLPELP